MKLDYEIIEEKPIGSGPLRYRVIIHKKGHVVSCAWTEHKPTKREIEEAYKDHAFKPYYY